MLKNGGNDEVDELHTALKLGQLKYEIISPYQMADIFANVLQGGL